MKAGMGVPLTVYVPPDLLKRLDEHTARDNLSRSAAVRIMLRESLDRAEGKAS